MKQASTGFFVTHYGDSSHLYWNYTTDRQKKHKRKKLKQTTGDDSGFRHLGVYQKKPGGFFGYTHL